MRLASSLIPFFLAAGAMVQAAEPVDGTTTRLEEVTVTGTREKQSLSETPSSVGIVKDETLGEDKPTHPSQVISQVPGAAVAVTNGEGHTTSIRQPFTTAPVYLFLEDGIPIRSTGFFNHNALYEIDIPQSGGVEVIRGPGTALYGSDAIGGVVNVLTRTPPTQAEASVSGEAGSFGWWRLLTDGGNASGNDSWRADLNLTHTDGWRNSTAYDRQSGVARWDRAVDANVMLKTVFAFSMIDQQTGANSPLKQSDYFDNPTKNYLPIAYRKVNALRLSSTYERESGDDLVSVIPYLRDNSMDLLASFTLNSDPTVYTDENKSFGVMAKWRRDFPQAMRARLIVGTDVDVSPGGHEEDALNVNTTGSAPSRQFNSYTVAARVYDYDVTFQGVSPYVHGEISPTEKWRITGGLRYDYLTYDFSNHVGGGAVQVPAFGFVGTRYYGQAGDTTTHFNHLSPKLGATYALNADTHAFAAYTHGFRAPSQSQLFRPSFGSSAAAATALMQSSLALKPIKADQVELGLRGSVGKITYDAAVYDLKKRDDIVSQRDPVTTFTQTVNAGKTDHRGLEIGAGTPIATGFRVDVAASYARHTYTDWVTTSANFSGKDMETAPREIANTRLTWQPASKGPRVQLEWVHLGSYWLDAANTQKYPGHELFNLRANWPVAGDVSVFGSIYNLADKHYADSASLSSNQPVLSPGLPRTFYAGVEVKW